MSRTEGTNLLLHDILVLVPRLPVREGRMKIGGLCILPLTIKEKRNAHSLITLTRSQTLSDHTAL
jgi:hypothetical protein